MTDHDEWCAAVRQLQRWYGSSGETARHITEVVREIEREEGIPPTQAAPTVREATFRAWARDGQSTRNPRWRRAVMTAAARLPSSGEGEQHPQHGVESVVANDLTRRSFLKLTAAISLLGMPTAGPDPQQFARRAEQLWFSCATSEPRALAQDAYRHVEACAEALRDTRGGGADWITIAGAAAMSSILVGRVAFFDLGRPDVAEAAYCDAHRFLSGSPDHLLYACLAAHQAFIPGWAGDYDAASPYLDSAAGLAEHRGGGPRLRAWTHCVRAELLTKTSRDRTSEARAEIERARSVLAAGGAHADQKWVDFFDSSMLSGFEAGIGLASALRILRPDATPTTKVNQHHARNRAERAVNLLADQPRNGSDPQGSVTLLDIATGQALLDAHDEAIVSATAALERLAHRPYKVAHERLGRIYPLLPSAAGNRLYEAERAYGLAV